MIALLKKDFLISRFSYTLLTLFVTLAIIGLSIVSKEGSIVIGTMGSAFIPLIVNKFASTEEMRKHYDVVMNSFPVKRSDVVISKFIFYLIIYFLTAALFMIITTLFNGLQGFELSMFLFVNSLIFIYYILFIGIPNAIFYCTDYEAYMKYSAIITIVIVNLPILGGVFLEKAFPGAKESLMKLMYNTSIYKSILIVLGFGLLLYIALMIISIVGYRKKDLA